MCFLKYDLQNPFNARIQCSSLQQLFILYCAATTFFAIFYVFLQLVILCCGATLYFLAILVYIVLRLFLPISLYLQAFHLVYIKNCNSKNTPFFYKILQIMSKTFIHASFKHIYNIMPYCIQYCQIIIGTKIVISKQEDMPYSPTKIIQ